MARKLPLVNSHERKFEELAERHGWESTKRGWPDFLTTDKMTGEKIAVEVKPKTKSGRLQYLKREQADCMDFLKAHGIKCYVSDGEVLEPYKRSIHRPKDCL